MISTIHSIIRNLKTKMDESGEKIKLVRPYKEEIKIIIKKLEAWKGNKNIMDLIHVLETNIVNSKSNVLAKKHRDIISQLLVELGDITQENITEDQDLQIYNLIREIQEESLENELDMECPRYNKFNEKRPAPYINFHERDGVYRIRIDGGQELLRNKSLSVLIQKLKKDVFIPPKFTQILSEIGGMKQIMYNNKKIIIYKHPSTNEPLYDFNHVIGLCTNLDSRNSEHEYERNKNKIKIRSFKENVFGGFYIKEFISQEDFYNMILHSTTDFSQRFKTELSRLLDRWTKEGVFTMDHNQIISPPLEDPFREDSETYHFTQTYKNLDLVDFVKGLIQKQKRECWRRYHKKHVMYLILVICRDPKGKDRIIVKIGYSHDFIQRIHQLRCDNGNCNIYVLGLKYVNSQTDEKEFHKLIQIKFPYLKVSLENRQEYYVFDENLWKEFYTFDDSMFTPSQDRMEELDREAERILEEYFGDLEDRLEITMINKTVIPIELIQNDHQRIVAEKNVEVYKYLMEKREERLKMKTFEQMPENIRLEWNRNKEMDFLTQMDQESRSLWLRNRQTS